MQRLKIKDRISCNFPFSSVSAKMTSQEATHLPALRIEDYQVRRFEMSKKLDTVCIRDLDKCKLIGALLLGLSNFLPLPQLLQKIPLASKIKCSSYLRFFS